MNPPAPGPVRGDSAANDISAAATAASTAFPPSRSTRAPASAVSGCPPATTPLMGAMLEPQPAPRGPIPGTGAAAPRAAQETFRRSRVARAEAQGQRSEERPDL